jgi:hypothetical protein
MTDLAPTPLSAEYLDGWREGVCACLVAFMTRDSGGYISARDKNGRPEEFMPMGFLMEVVADLRLHPQSPKTKHDDKLDGTRG